MTDTERRYDIDWLRVIAIGLLLIYHIGIAFQPWGVFIGFIQSNDSLNWLWGPLSMLNIWRIPLLFFVSGMGVSFAIRKRNWGQLMLERTRRILIPFIFGMFFIAPLHVFLWQSYYKQDINYSVNPVHLWFLANIFLYVLLLSPLFLYMRKKLDAGLGRAVARLFSHPVSLVLIAAFFVIEAIVLNPETYATYAMNLHGFLVGFLAFLFGFLLVYAGEGARKMIMKWRWITLLMAIVLFVIRSVVFDLTAPNTLIAIESNMWIFSAFGFASQHLDRPGKTLAYLAQAAYPVYILHMIFLYLGSYLIMPLDIPVILQFILIVLFTFAGCLLVYEFIIRRVRFLRPLFGLRLGT